MNSPSLPLPGPYDPSTPAGSAVEVDVNDSAFVLEREALPTPRIEASRGGPPVELMQEVAAAGAIAEQLAASGYEMRFFLGEAGARVSIEIHDRDGNSLCTLAAAEAVQMAAEPAHV